MNQTQVLTFPDMPSFHRFGDLRRRMLFLFLICFASATRVLGQETNPSGTKVGTELQQSDLGSQPIPSNIEFVSDMLKKQLKKDLDAIGKVEDVAFDLETEHLALLVASNGMTGESKRYALLPFIPGDRLIQFGWEKKLTLQTQPLSFGRAQATELYRDYKQTVYWVDFAKKKLAASNAPFDDKDFSLTFYSNLKKRTVVDSAGTAVGKIEDVAVRSSNGELLYIVMLSSNGGRRAVPLGAFVSDEGSDHWSIDLTAEQIFKFLPFQTTSPPTGVDRGWEEYVAVKYGRGGLQTSKKVE